MHIAAGFVGLLIVSATALKFLVYQAGIQEADHPTLGPQDSGQLSSTNSAAWSDHFAFSPQFPLGPTNAASFVLPVPAQQIRVPAPEAAASRTLPRAASAANSSALQLSDENRAKALQKELKRVGCYSGDVNGDWNPMSRKALSAFLQRLNAVLPTEEPDIILLTLVQGQTKAVCTTGCKAGQSMTDGGRCVPGAVPAQEASKPALQGDRVLEATVVQTPQISTPPWSAVNSGKIQARANDIVLAPWAPAPTLPLASQTAPPLSGRMTIGGPIETVEAEALTVEAASGITTATLPSFSRSARDNDTKRAEHPARPRRDTSWTTNFFNDRR